MEETATEIAQLIKISSKSLLNVSIVLQNSTEHTDGLSDNVVARRVGEALVLAHMKNFMPILSEKSSDCFTFARWPHQHRSALTPGGKCAYFDFFGLNSWSEQGTLMVDFFGREEEKH